MMNILAIECSQTTASVALASEQKLLYEHQWVSSRNHDAELFPALQQALERIEEGGKLELILVGAGPGSYGGVRVALAAATGISMLKAAQVIAIDSWAQLAEQKHHLFSDAKRGSWTLRDPQGRINVISKAQLIELIENPQLSLQSIETEQTLQNAQIPPCAQAGKVTASGLIRTWLELSEAEQNELAAQIPAPIYVQPPHITKAKKKPWEC